MGEMRQYNKDIGNEEEGESGVERKFTLLTQQHDLSLLLYHVVRGVVSLASTQSGYSFCSMNLLAYIQRKIKKKEPRRASLSSTSSGTKFTCGFFSISPSCNTISILFFLFIFISFYIIIL